MTTIIRKGLIYTPDHAPARTDMLIRDGVIAHLGPNIKIRGARVVNAIGCSILPGLIEPNTTEGDKKVFNAHEFKKKYQQQGITSIIVGQAGISRAPINKDGLSLLEESGGEEEAAIAWRTVHEFNKAISKKRLPINIGTYAGYSSMRRSIIGEEKRALTKKELDILERTCEESLEDGAVGISLNVRRMSEECIDSKELKVIQNISHKNNAPLICSVKSIYESEWQQLMECLERLLSLATPIFFTDVTTNIKEGIENLREKLLTKNKVYYSKQTNQGALIKTREFIKTHWLKEPDHLFLKKLENKNFQEDIKKELKSLKYDRLTISVAPKPYSFLEGKEIGELSEGNKKSQEETLFDLIKKFQLKGVFMRNMNVQATELKKNDSGELAQNEWSALEPGVDLIKKRTDLSLIKEKTKDLAHLLKLKKRGQIEKEYYADCLIIKNQDHKIKHVFVNGEESESNGKYIERNLR